MPEDKASSRAPWATLIATAAVTVAVGVTAAALGGYIVPAREAAAPLATPVAPQAPAPSGGANVVLVPIAPDVPAASPAAAEPAFELVNYQAREPEAHRGRSQRAHEGREHEEREDEGDHEDEGEHDDD